MFVPSVFVSLALYIAVLFPFETQPQKKTGLYIAVLVRLSEYGFKFGLFLFIVRQKEKKIVLLMPKRVNLTDKCV